MNGKFNIRLADIQDAPICAKIHIDSWNFTYSGIVPDDAIEKNNAKRHALWSKLLENNIDSHYAITLDDEIIGFLTINKPFEKDLPKDTYFLTGLYLAPEYIGRGFGKRTMDWIKNEVSARGQRGIALYVLDKNGRAKRFYEKSGFLPDGNVIDSGLGDTKEERYIYSFEK